MSDYWTDAIDRMADVGPWYLVDGKTKVFANKAGLATVPSAAISMFENGGSVDSENATYANGDRLVWTGTTTGGRKQVACLNWTWGTPETGTLGDALAQDSRWTIVTDFGLPSYETPDCEKQARLYCFEQ
ncbi:MAG: hypothetical protein QM765_28885 [Myxococcales bacterium]